MTTSIFGNLEVDYERGVIYFHASPQAMSAGFTPTPLRICGIGEVKFPLGDRQIDITIRPSVIKAGQLIARVSK
jgi:hypothetical protein